MRNHLLQIFIATLISLAVFAGLNWIVDPAHLYSQGKYEFGVAQQLNKGKVISGVTNYDERLLQLYRLQNFETDSWKVPDTIVIGSSRSMQIHSGTGINNLNLSVSGASLEDYIAILQVAHLLPYKRIIIGVDPWVFNKNNSQSRWGSICIYWRMGMKEILDISVIKSKCTENKWQQLFNFSYTLSSANLLLSSILQPNSSLGKWYAKLDDTPEQMSDLIRPDGSRVYNTIFAEKPVNHVVAKAKAYGKPPIYALCDFSLLDEDNKLYFEKLIHQLRQNKEVIIFLPPYHPSTYPLIVANVPLVKDVEFYLHRLAEKERVQLIVSYNPINLECFDEDFFDGMHPKDSCITKIFASYINNLPRSNRVQ